jgi:dolichyl-diphosphooligosaccharide--protein glycosyltransferase
MTLLDPTYAKKYIPIIASVSEHQPTAWTNYFFDMGYLVLFLPLGYYFCLIEDVTHGKLFIGIYGVLATYFSCVMIRLMLTLAPAVCIIAAIAINEIFEKSGASIRQSIIAQSWDVTDTNFESKEVTGQKAVKKEKKPQEKQRKAVDANEEQRKSKLLPLFTAVAVMLIVFSLLQH